VIAAWPSFALIASYELLMRQVRRASSGRIDAGADIQEISRWINGTKAERLAAEAMLRTSSDSPGRMTRDEISALVHRTASVNAALRNADLGDKTVLYKGLNLRQIYEHMTGIIRVEARERPGRSVMYTPRHRETGRPRAAQFASRAVYTPGGSAT
jgi:hypothetical protein